MKRNDRARMETLIHKRKSKTITSKEVNELKSLLQQGLTTYSERNANA